MASMNNFWIGSVVTMILVAPIVIFFAVSSSQPQPSTPTVGNQLEQPGELPKEIFTVNEKCVNELSNSTTGAVSSECMNYEAFLTNDFMNKIQEEVSKDESINCAKNLPTDLSSLDKKIQGNTAQVIIEGNNIVEGKEENSGDLQVEFIRTEDDWEISDIRCLD
jgi:hypothetical protein